MSFRSAIKSRIAEYITSETRLRRKRETFEKQRKRQGHPHEVHYFHHVSDPYSHLALQKLAGFQKNYAVKLTFHLISGPPAWATPDRTGLDAYALMDANQLAAHLGLSGVSQQKPSAERVTQAEAAMAVHLSESMDIRKLQDISNALWSNNEIALASEVNVEDAKAQGDALLEKLGHYLGATFYYEGEWYWGVDRLHYLEDRLHQLGLGPAPSSNRRSGPDQGVSDARVSCNEIDLFLSFRSPYSYLAFNRTCELSDRLGAKLNILPVLPMVMRGLPVPPAKRKYILMDAAREARSHGIPFGRICDPLGRPIERGYSLLQYAQEEGCLREYCSAFMTSVWSEGVDADTDNGLAKIIEAAGLDWSKARTIVDNDDWRVQIEKNRENLTAPGLWGVPSYRVGTTAIWGQDRIWAVEAALQHTTTPIVSCQP
ncbi:DsbA family protein [Pseudovibrio brasiliensis]|uniref:DsbA family protein n=1 Tax=Pseudovibrio brasiliensis TaxID=1898042 RepID=A0ABX8ARP5_9HYPH|nr:DsbA family protein [Pseudovibrio brasiliensis]QUS57713.1 DsbA family protein [Pseudovibrio brasiliensis]